MDVSGLADWLGLQTAAGKAALAEKLASGWQKDPRAASQQFASCQAALAGTNLAPAWQRLASIEAELEPLIKPASALEHETYSELLFLSDWSKPLNFVPYLLALWTIFRVYILPGMSMMLPFLVLVLPYFVIKYVMRVPMETRMYFSILQGILKGEMPGLGPAQPAAAAASPAKMVGQLVWIGTTLFQAIAQPWWNYKHLSKVDGIICQKASLIGELSDIYDSISSTLARAGITTYANPLAGITGDRVSLADVLTDPIPVRHCLRLLGQLEAFTSLATTGGICPVKWTTGGLKITGLFDFHVADAKPVTIDMCKRRHVLLTGPNRGGKSTVLRAVASAVVLAHTYGCSFGTYAEMQPLATLHCCLKPDDLPGTKSRFEREVEFTAGTLIGGPSMILIDELYHSTNPPDALEACRVYCGKLWGGSSGNMSIISTHLFGLVDDADGATVQKLCCPAEMGADKHIRFLYGLEEGVCRVSSVHELLAAAGMA
jgi:hypothetical protein